MNNSDRDPASTPKLHSLYVAMIAGFAALGVGGACLPAFAQTADPVGSEKLETVTVTARKVSEQDIDVPISLQVVSEKELRASGTYDLYDLKNIGGFNFTNYSSNAQGRSNGVIVFRGLQGGTGLVSENSGSLFIDGIFVSSGQATVNTIDVSRVEILKGPQNAFFGRSTFGGAINYITKTPSTDRIEGAVNGTLTDRGSTDFDASIEGPIVRNLLSARLTVYNHSKSATYRTSDGGDLGAEKTRGITGTLYFTPTENTWVRLRSNFQKDDDSLPAVGFIPATGNTSCSGVVKSALDIFGNPIQFTPGVQYFCGSIPSHASVGNGVINANSTLSPALAQTLASNDQGDQFLKDGPKLDHTGLRRDSNHQSLSAGITLPYKTELVFNSGYNQSNQVSVYDLDGSSAQNFLPIQTINAHDTTLDMRLSSDRDFFVRGLLGVSYFDQVYHLSQIDYTYPLANGTQAPCVLRTFVGAPGCTNLNQGNYSNNHSRVPAVYGSVDIDVLPNLTLNGEVRRQRDTITSVTYLADAAYTNTAKNWLPRVSIRFKPTEDLMIYASASKGVQPLSLNTGYINANAAQRAQISSIVPGASEFTPQPEVKGYELGVKQRLLDGRVQYSLTAFNSRWNDRLTLATVFNSNACIAAGTALTPACPLATSGTSVFYGNNARIKGTEFSIDTVPLRNWSAGGNVTYIDGRWTKFYSGGSTSSFNAAAAVLNRNAYYFNGNELGKQPKWTANVNSTVRFPGIYENFKGYVRGDVFYTGRSWESDFNYARSDPVTKVNLRAGVEGRGATVELFVKNLFNNKDWQYAYRGANLTLVPLTSFAQQGTYVGAPDPREVGVRIAYRF